MKSIAGSLLVSIFIFQVSVFGQDWVNKFVEEQKLTLTDANKIVACIGEEMKKNEGTKTPDIVFQKLDSDSSARISDFNSNVCVINFWSTSCSACRMQLPELSKLQSKYSKKGLRIIYISAEKREVLLKFFSENKIDGIKGRSEINGIVSPYQVFAKPSSFIIDKNGIIRESWLGAEKLNELEKRVPPYL